MSLPALGGAAILAVGALAAEVAPMRAAPIAAAAGAALFVALHPAYALYHLVLVATLFACRRRGLPFAAALGALALALPKTLFATFLGIGLPSGHGSTSRPLPPRFSSPPTGGGKLAMDGRRRALPPPANSWALLFFFPTHAAYPISIRTRRPVGAAAARARGGDGWRGTGRSEGARAHEPFGSGCPASRFAPLCPAPCWSSLGEGHSGRWSRSTMSSSCSPPLSRA